MGVSLEAMLLKVINVFILLSVFGGQFVSSDEDCNVGTTSLVYTIPRGDIVIKYGDPLDIYCILNEEAAKGGPNASQHLEFYRRGQRLSGEMIQILNSTTVRLHVEKPAKTILDNYVCRYSSNKKYNKMGAVCTNFVYVAVPPQPVTDFKCISYNLDNLTCRWTAPENYVTTSYNLSFSVDQRPFFSNECPKIETTDGSPIMSCTWTLETSPIYRQSAIDYDFYLNATNVFGTYRMNNTHFKHLKHMKPNPPQNLKVLGKTWNSVNLSWTVPTTIQSVPLVHRILYQSSYGKKEWQSRPEEYRKSEAEIKFTLDNLEFAHAYYDIRVTLRSSVADPNDENMWSDNASITVLTPSKKPDAPPRTTLGSFEILTYGNNSDRTVRIYWSHIPEEKRNGENFSYVVSLPGTGFSQTTEHAYMVIEQLSRNQSYTFHISARNEKGTSDQKSIVRVPRYKDCARQPTKVTKEEFGGGQYRLSWQHPKLESHQTLKNYTIFWCNDEREIPPCAGKLEWVVVPGTFTSHNQSIASNKTFQFAISANINGGSSGMTWTQCTDLFNKFSVGKINSFAIDGFGSNFAKVKWSFGCSDKSVTGYIIYYCPIYSPQKMVCKETEKNVTVHSRTTQASIDHLAPYTTYTFQVAAIINRTTYSQLSESIQVTTYEAAPSIPTRLNITNVTNSTITITWKPPVVMNGKLKYYNIYYNDKNIQVDPSEIPEYQLTNLSSYKNYTIRIEACTIVCSNSSEIVQKSTEIGYPSPIRRPFITQNATYTLISWDTPLEPNGRNERYELKIKEKHDSENISRIINITEREWGLDNCAKENKFNSFYVSVRAVNLDKNKTYYGEWSDEVESYCRSPSNYVIYILVPAIILFLLGMTYLFKKMYSHFQEMRDVGVKLPQGLQGEVIETNINLSNWSQKPGNEDSDHHTADDEEHLLMKKSEGSPILHGDSSGCSSAHESVTCSVDSASNISSSTSDSGTEQPRQSAEDMGEVGVTTSLRQRNIRPSSISKPYVALPLDPNSSIGTKLAPKSYCVLGVDPNTNPDTSSTYIPLPSGGEMYHSPESPHSTPYVMTGELVKSTNPSYIPYKPTLPADLSTKNPTYVIAGNKDLLSPDVLNIENKQVIAPQDSSYIKIADNLALKNADLTTWQPPSSSTNTKPGYVSIGDVPPMKKETKGYVPHRQFESKTLKED